jgi:hypothetical protein
MEISQENSLYRYFKQTKTPFFKNRELEGKIGHIGEFVPVGREST